MSLAESAPQNPAPLQYARFSRRLKAMFIDWTISLAVIFGAVIAASVARNDDISRALGFAVLATLLLYEPVLVSRLGGTLGHYWTNLRIVDDAHGGHISFPKSVARFAIKALLGWYSFIVMAATRRNQAVHDLMTRSTVQARDPESAAPGHFIAARTDLDSADLPPRWRRLVVICTYSALAMIAFVLATDLLVEMRIVSVRCLDRGFCAGSEKGFSAALVALTLIALAAIATLGWKGRLWGARRR